MQKQRNIKVFVPESTLQPGQNSENEQVRFELYRKGKEIREIAQILKGLSLKSRDERRAWLQENEDLMANLADSETLELSVQVMTALRKTLGLFQTVMAGNEELEA